MIPRRHSNQAARKRSIWKRAKADTRMDAGSLPAPPEGEFRMGYRLSGWRGERPLIERIAALDVRVTVVVDRRGVRSAIPFDRVNTPGWVVRQTPLPFRPR